MGRKSVSYVDESSLLKMRLRDALDDEACRVSGSMDDESAVMAAPASLPGSLTLEDLYRRNRNRARLTGLLHSQRSSHGASIIVLMCNADEGLHDRDAMGWIVQSPGGDQFAQAMPRPAH